MMCEGTIIAMAIEFGGKFISFTSVRPFIMVALFVYLIFHALNGNHGIYAYLQERNKLHIQTVQLHELQQETAQLAQQITNLSDDSLDLDLLEERARIVLGYAKKDEIIYIYPPNSHNHGE